MYYSTTYLSPLGKITLACDACGKNLVGLCRITQRGRLRPVLLKFLLGLKSCRLMAGRAKVLSGYAEGSFD